MGGWLILALAALVPPVWLLLMMPNPPEAGELVRPEGLRLAAVTGLSSVVSVLLWRLGTRIVVDPGKTERQAWWAAAWFGFASPVLGLLLLAIPLTLLSGPLFGQSPLEVAPVMPFLAILPLWWPLSFFPVGIGFGLLTVAVARPPREPGFEVGS